MPFLSVRVSIKGKRKLDVKARSKGMNTSDYIRVLVAKDLKMKPEEVFDSASDAQTNAQSTQK